jgi:tRNA(adenine34) deaminase
MTVPGKSQTVKLRESLSNSVDTMTVPGKSQTVKLRESLSNSVDAMTVPGKSQTVKLRESLSNSGDAMTTLTPDERWMEFAIREAELASGRKEVPIGAIIIHDNRIVGRGYNQTETLQDPTAHAEMIAITAAAMNLGSRRLERCTLYVTLEPCAMCAGAIVLARLPRLVYGAPDPKAGACGTLFNVVQDARLNHRVDLAGGILSERCGEMLSVFFAKVRQKGPGKSGKDA